MMGRLIFFLNNIDQAPRVISTKASSPENWVGVELKNVLGAPAIGAKIIFHSQKTKQMRELFRTNGYASQSGSRIIFSFPESDQPVRAEIIWPNGEKFELSHFRMNQYNAITQKNR
jgi:hypothetical protein